MEGLESRLAMAALHNLIGLTTLRADPNFSTIDGSGVSVAVIDTGLDRTHPLLSPNYIAGADLVAGTTTPTPILGGAGPGAHGTHVAGIIGARDPNIGVATQVGLIGLQVFTPLPGSDATAEVRHIQDALEWVLANRQHYNIVAVNMSLGSGLYTSPAQVNSTLYTAAIRRLEQAGVTVVSAAGNSYGLVTDPRTGGVVSTQYANSSAPGIISTLNVGAVWEGNDGGPYGPWDASSLDLETGADRIASFSQRPPQTPGNAIFAPGAAILSTIPGGRLAEFSGTSMATPVVTGVVALVQEAALRFGGRLLTPVEVRNLLLTTADTIRDGDDERDALYLGDTNGNGRIDSQELTSLTHTNQDYARINVYRAVTQVRSMFTQVGGGSSDANGTIAGAIAGPTLDGAPQQPVVEAIGVDASFTSIGGSDVDIFRFQVETPGVVTLEVGSHPTQPADFNSMLRLFSAAGTELAANDDIDGTNPFSRLNISLAPGTYYAGISGTGNRNYNPFTAGSGATSGASGRYALNFRLTNSDPNGTLAGAVLTNFGSARDPVSFNGLISADYGEPVSTSDVDVFEVFIPDNGTLFINIDTPYDGVAERFVNSYLRIYDANGVELAHNDNALAIDAALRPIEFADPLYPGFVFPDPVVRSVATGHTTDSFMAARVLRDQKFYVSVSDVCNQTFDSTSLVSRPNCGQGGRYDITFTFLNNDLNGSVDQLAAAAPLTLPSFDRPGFIGADGNSGSGQLQTVGERDVDFTKIRSGIGGVLDVAVTSHGTLGNVDPVDATLMLFDAQGRRLAMFRDGQGLDPVLRYVITANTDYYLAVTGNGNENFDPFQLGSGTPGDTGAYLVTTRIITEDDAATDFWDDVYGRDQVSTVSYGAVVNGYLGHDRNLVRGGTDIDLYRFTATASGQVDVTTAGQGDAGADTMLRVFTTAGLEIVFNDDASATTTASRVRFTAEAGQTYILGVSGHGPQSRGYNPLTGAGVGTGSLGAYQLLVSSAEVAGDANRDGRVDRTDLAIVGANLGLRNGATWQQGDFNGDGKVSLSDLRLLQQNFGAVPSPSAESPSALAAAGPGAAAAASVPAAARQPTLIADRVDAALTATRRDRNAASVRLVSDRRDARESLQPPVVQLLSAPLTNTARRSSRSPRATTPAPEINGE